MLGQLGALAIKFLTPKRIIVIIITASVDNRTKRHPPDVDARSVARAGIFGTRKKSFIDFV